MSSRNQAYRQKHYENKPYKRKSEAAPVIDLGAHLAAGAKKELSDKVVAMKFMQRSVVKETQEKETIEAKKQIAESHWVVKYSTLPIEKPVAYEPGYFSWGSADTHVAGGRKSYKEFNTTVENLERQRKEELAALEMQQSVQALHITDEDMALHMSKKIRQSSPSE
ncbi:hypothetical protein DSO57_1015401 [Entomophthora muscae]|uniref:Uncharacterized protein n=1 Tax=Entomophthora muscae TaxID=34485 RepID=A0ACC2SIA5_9FUNG|nr:hypothetical protein DSO57_1015401 [Entomophthora muscae]